MVSDFIKSDSFFDIYNNKEINTVFYKISFDGKLYGCISISGKKDIESVKIIGDLLIKLLKDRLKKLYNKKRLEIQK